MSNKREEARRRRGALLHRNENPFGRFMRRYKVLVIVLAILVILCGVIIFLLTRSKPEPDMGGYDFDVTMEPEDENEINAGGEENIEDITAAEDPIDELEGLGDDPTKDKGYKHYLLLGLDGLTGGFKGKRSDAIMIASVNQKAGRLVLTSIPRDTYVYIEGKGYDKITHAYAYGQAQLTVETIENNFDIDIENYFTINFDGMEKLVDLVGGVPMTLTQAESNNIRDFFGVPGTRAGDNLLTGVQALTYCRVRMIDSDFKRTERQYKVLMALYDKAKTMSPTKYPELLKTVYDYLYTDATISDCIGLATDVMGMGIDSMENVLLFSNDNGAGKMINGIYYFVPHDLEQTIREWRKTLGVEDYEPSEALKTYSDYLKSR